MNPCIVDLYNLLAGQNHKIMNIDWSSLISAFIGGSLTLVGVFITHWLTIRKEENNKKEDLRALIQSIKSEATTIWQIYMEGVGTLLEEHRDTRIFHYVHFERTQDWNDTE